MSSSDHTMKYTSPPPKYEDVVFGAPAGVHGQEGAATAPRLPQNYTHEPLPYVLIPREQLQPVVPGQLTDTFCPAGFECLLTAQEIKVYPSQSRVIKIKNPQKELVFTAKYEYEGDCLTCCCEAGGQMGFTIRTPDKRPLAYMKKFNDSGFFTDIKYMDVSVIPDVPLGRIQCKNNTKFTISNTSGDQLFIIRRKTSFLSNTIYEINRPDGPVFALIEVAGIKHKLKVPPDMQWILWVSGCGTALTYVNKQRKF
ncbi:hypothetical protein Hamer_G000718, partial [Homarus americanus]